MSFKYIALFFTMPVFFEPLAAQAVRSVENRLADQNTLKTTVLLNAASNKDGIDRSNIAFKRLYAKLDESVEAKLIALERLTLSEKERRRLKDELRRERKRQTILIANLIAENPQYAIKNSRYSKTLSRFLEANDLRVIKAFEQYSQGILSALDNLKEITVTARPKNPLAERCRLPAEVIKVAIADGYSGQGIVRTNQSGPIGNALAAIARSKAASDGINSGVTRNLVLSGGGQHGSFGSGFLKGMQDSLTFPRYDIVTGVSTGALQSTFALIGSQSAPNDRKLDIRDDFPEFAAAIPRTNLDDLVASYTIRREATLYNEKGIGGVIRKAAKGNLAPLSVRLDRLITAETLEAVKQAHSQGRRLFVALLNYESGDTEIIDMTALAARYDGSNFDLIQHCYNQVLIAASSEPIGAPPVVIDQKLYFDAGLRYGAIIKQFFDDATAIANRVAHVRTDIIVNDDLNVDPSGDTFKKKFSVFDITERSRKIVINQAHRLAVSEVIKQRGARHMVRFASIRGSEANNIRPAPKATFDPKYMRHMIALGINRGAAGDWQVLTELATME
jgi:predicted acylesterase/phospholipase RssA